MIKLTLKDFEYFARKQALLDNSIMQQKNISDDEWNYILNNHHTIALKVEVAEFVNECSDLWKYWKDKEPHRERILDEAIDVLHFVFLKLNKKHDLPKGHYLDYFRTATMTNEVLKHDKDKSEWLSALLRHNDELKILSIVMFILSDYGFTRDDVINQYNKKNAVNFERLESGY